MTGILRSNAWHNYQKHGGSGVVWWNERLVHPKLLSSAIANIYGYTMPILDCGYIIASG